MINCYKTPAHGLQRERTLLLAQPMLRAKLDGLEERDDSRARFYLKLQSRKGRVPSAWPEADLED